MEKLCEGLKNIIEYITCVLFSLIIVWLLVVSGFSTSYMNIDSEYTYFVSDNVWCNIFICIGFIFLVYGGRKFIVKSKAGAISDEHFIHLGHVLLICIGVIALVIVLSYSTVPRADQLKIMNAAYELRQGDYTMFSKGYYVQAYQNQKGIVVFIYFLGILFGDYNYIIFQMLNVLALVLVYKEIQGIVRDLGLGSICQSAVLIFGIVFLPLLLYTTFVYGTIVSLAFALMALRHEMLYFKEYKRRDLAESSFAIAFSISIKSNSLIFLIAMIIYAFVNILSTRKAKAVILIITTMLFCFFLSAFVDIFIVIKTGQSMEKGVSPWAFVAMGLQEGDLADGWFNHYTDSTYSENGCDSARQEEEAKAYIEDRLNFFWENKEYALQFMGHKVASQWNNPSFQCFWIVNTQTSNIEQPEWVKNMHSVHGQVQFGGILNYIQFIIYMGCLIFIIFDNGRIDMSWILLQMVFVGGFLFHIFWEAKCQYTLPYFMLLIPIAIKGYSNVGTIVDTTYQEIRKKQYFNKASIFMILFIGIVVFVQISNSDWVKAMVKIDDNADKFESYLAFNTTDKIRRGEYSIRSFSEDTLSIACLDLYADTNSMIGLLPDQQDNIYIVVYKDRVYFQFIGSNLYLDLNQGEEIENGVVQAHEGNGSDAQKWIIRKDKDNEDTYYILIGTHSALSYDKESKKVCINKFTGSADQKWIIK